METVLIDLFALRDEKYAAFQAKIVPNIPPETIIGVRTPLLRDYAKKIRDTDEAAAFLSELPHRYFDENQLHAFLLERIKPFDAAVAAVDRFLPYVDNWATCDVLSPKVFKMNTDALLPPVERWLASDRPYTQRFAIEMLMSHYLDEKFDPVYHERVAAVTSEEYYANMMRAWYFATALAKQYDATVPVLTSHRLDDWTHNKTIQKAVESYRITEEQKAYLKTLKRK